MIEIEQYRQMLPRFNEDTLYEEKAFALSEEWREQYKAIQEELHKRGLIDEEALARDPFDPATIAAEDSAHIASMNDAELVEFFNSVKPTYEATDTWEPFKQLVAYEVKKARPDARCLTMNAAPAMPCCWRSLPVQLCMGC